MKKAIKQLPTFAARTYRGGKVMRAFLGLGETEDDFYPEDWISSFTEAKNKNYVPAEGLTRVLFEGKEALLTDCVTAEDFGEGRDDSGVLIKFIDSAERLGIQVHPTKAYAREYFDSSYGKTECWHILAPREDAAEPPCVYLGFKENVTKESWKELFDKQDIEGMLGSLHRFEVAPGDTILVCGGTPHAIGAENFLLEIQEPSDYTMRVEKTTLAGEELTPKQIHYGVGEEAMLDCFDYTPHTREEIMKMFFLKPKKTTYGTEMLVDYNDTPCFALEKTSGGTHSFEFPHFVTVVTTKAGGKLLCAGEEHVLRAGDKFFIPAKAAFTLEDATALICYPPKK